MEPTQDEFGQPLNGFRYMGEVRGTKTTETMKIKIGQRAANFMASMSTQVFADGEKPYQFIPCWFKETEKKNVFEVFYLDNLPKELTDRIAELRERSAIEDVINS